RVVAAGCGNTLAYWWYVCDCRGPAAARAKWRAPRASQMAVRARRNASYFGRGRLAAAAEDPQQADDEVDEVEVEGERAEDRELLRGVAVGDALRADLLDLLHVVRRQAGEDDHAEDAEDQVEGRAADEDEH